MRQLVRLALISLIVLSIPVAAHAVYDDYPYRIRIKITNPKSKTYTNTPVLVEMDTYYFVRTGRMNADLSDIRFSDGSTGLNFWMMRAIAGIHGQQIWVKALSIPPGNSYIYMHFGKSGASCKSNCSGVFLKCDEFMQGDYSSDDFSFEGWTEFDNKWWRTGSPYYYSTSSDSIFANVEFQGMKGNGTFINRGRQGKSRIYQWQTKEWTYLDFSFYFLRQATDTSDIHENTYRLRVYGRLNDQSTHGNTIDVSIRHYNDSGTETNIGQVTLPDIYNNTEIFWKVRVSGSKIWVYANGNHILTANRIDSWEKGYFGFKTSDYTSVGIVFVLPYKAYHPSTEIMPHADIAVGSVCGVFKGEDMLEHIPQVQIVEQEIDGYGINEYINNLMAMENQVVHFCLQAKNRGAVSDTFSLSIEGEVSGWVIQFSEDGGSNWSKDPPSGFSLGPGNTKAILVRGIPTDTALFEGGILNGQVKIEAETDLSYDKAAVNTRIRPRLSCYWNYRRKITLDYNDLNGTGDLIDYQVKVDLDQSEIFGHAKDNGADIRFTTEDGSIIPYTIESWDGELNKATVWAKVPRIEADTDTTIYIWYGNEAALDAGDKKKTFELWDDFNTRSSLNSMVEPGDKYYYDFTRPSSSGVTSCAAGGDYTNPDYWWTIAQWPAGPSGNNALYAPHHMHNQGPAVSVGDINWGNIELSVLFKSPCSSYSGGSWGNPLGPLVRYQDDGNFWFLEIFTGKQILRPHAAGRDFTWQYANYVSGFPNRSYTYSYKGRVFRGGLQILMNTTGYSSDDADYSEIADFSAPPSFTLDFGKIGFIGFDGGFYFDDIQVRKYTVPEPSVTVSGAEGQSPIEIGALSDISLAYLPEGDRLYTSTFTPWSWIGDSKAYALPYQQGDDPDWSASEHLKTVDADERLILTNDADEMDFLDFTDNEANEVVAKDHDALKELIGLDDDFLTDRLVNYARGVDIEGWRDRTDPITETVWKLGDIVHSTPVVIIPPPYYYPFSDYQDFKRNYNDRDIFLYVGSNDGMLRAIDNESGEERWAWMPDAITERVAEIPDMSHDWMVDLAVKAADVKLTMGTSTPDDDEWKTILVVGMRTGGGCYYGLDVTEAADEASDVVEGDVSVLWKFTDADLGETWSEPAIALVRYASGSAEVAKSVIFVCSGYSESDGDQMAKQAYLYAIDAEDGSLLAKIKTSDHFNNVPTSSVVGDIDNDYYADVLYFGDLWGSLKRVSLDPESESYLFGDSPVASDVLELPGVPSGWDAAPNPHFPHPITAPPTLVSRGRGEPIGVLWGSGRFDQRFYDYSDEQYILMVYDDGQSTYTLSNLVDQTNERSEIPDEMHGWYVTRTTGEVVLKPPDAAGGTIFIVTYIIPQAFDTCSLGEGRLYAFHYNTGLSNLDDPEFQGEEGSDFQAEVGDGDILRRYIELSDGISSAPILDLKRETVYIQTQSGDIVKIGINLETKSVQIRSWAEVFE